MQEPDNPWALGGVHGWLVDLGLSLPGWQRLCTRLRRDAG